VKRIIASVLPLLLASSPSHAEGPAATGGTITDGNVRPSQTITRAGAQPSTKGPSAYFTGGVRVDPLFSAQESAPYSGGVVTFEPGARSAWHTHPAGQHLIVTAGVGWTQVWDGPVTEIRAGDVVWCPPGVKHWHGAASGSAMTHIALTGSVDGKNVEWMEKVSDVQYRK
jgi:quercetin dioxygenase-like cupin family protein